MAHKKPDIDFLRKQAERIHALDENLRASADSLLQKIPGTGGTDPDPAPDVRTDAAAAGEMIQTHSARLGRAADLLAALAQAYASLDDEAIEAFLRTRGEDEFIRTFFPAPTHPQIVGIEPFFLPQIRMVQSDWAQVYIQGPRQLTQTDTYHTGRIIGNVIGRWVNPKSKKVYSVFDPGDGVFAFIPEGKLSPPVDVSTIPNREEVFAEGQRGPLSDLWKPPAAEERKGEWHAPGDPWQNFILGNMRITGLRGAVFPATPHANLCGELSVFFSVGETDLESGLTRFAQLTGLGYWNIDGKKTEYTGTQVLQNAGHATSSYDIQRLFAEYGWTGRIHNGVMPMPDELAENLRSGKKIIFLTELDTRTKAHAKEDGAWIDNPDYGRLVPGTKTPAAGLAAHWAAVTGVFQDRHGEIRVSVWNTHSGCEETYSWDTFSRSGKNPGSSAGSFTFVEAVKGAG
jgi:hypothetical protein